MPSPDSQRLWYNWGGPFQNFFPHDCNVQPGPETYFFRKSSVTTSLKKTTVKWCFTELLAPSRQASDVPLHSRLCSPGIGIWLPPSPRCLLAPWLSSLGFCLCFFPVTRSPNTHTLLLLMQSSICSQIFARPSFTGSISGLISDFFWRLGVTGRAWLGGFQSGSKQQNLAFGWKQKNMSNNVSQEGWKVWTKTCQVSKLRSRY